MSESNDIYKNCVISDKYGEPYCIYHNCGPNNFEECGKIDCPHCSTKWPDPEDEYYDETTENYDDY